MNVQKMVMLKETAGQVANNLALIVGGSFLIALGANGILVPLHMGSGGFVGLSMVLHYLMPFIPLSVVYLMVNLPVYFLGYKAVGKRFMLYSLLGTALSTAALQWVHIIIPVKEPVPAALLAGILMGMGAGLTLRSHGSSGGLDILSVVLLKKFSVRLGTTALFFNTGILIALIMTMTLETAIYTLIYLFVFTHVLDLVVSGFSRRKSIIIISKKWREISKGIISEINRGATLIPAQGGYTGEREMVLYSVVAIQEISRFKRLVNQIDPKAFVVIGSTDEVMGWRIGNQPHW
ncbi:YitT family protein [Dethiosulfatarculus sandiegensis]|nr:YitT family protein [Dethiosulfatarculus sandiegensis]